MITRKRHLTLMEIMIVISIIALTAGFIGMNIAQAIREQRFRAEVGRVTDLLGLAQDLMLVMDVGTVVIFEQESKTKGIQMRMETTLPLPARWQHVFMRPQAPLSYVHWIEFENEDEQEKEGRLEIRFLSSGIGMSRGTLRLSTSASDSDLGALSSYLCFPGYPKALVVKSKADGEPACDFDAQESMLNHLTNILVDELKTLPGYYQEKEEEKEEQEKQEESSSESETQTAPEPD